MNKKLLSFLLMLTMIMFIGIDVRAACTQNNSAKWNTGNPDDCSGSCSGGTSATCQSARDSEGDFCCNYSAPASCSNLDAPDVEGSYSSGSPVSTDITYTSSGCTKPTGTPTCTVDSSYGTCTATTEEATFTVSYKGTDTKCKDDATITVTHGSLSDTFKVGVYVPWGTSPGGSTCIATGQQCNRNCAETQNLSKYWDGIDSNKSCEEGETAYFFYTRGCGKSNTPPNPQSHCYKDANGFLRYKLLEKRKERKEGTDTIYYISTEDVPSGWTIAKDANGNELLKEQCYTKFQCSTSFTGKRDIETSCNGTHTPQKEAGSDKTELSGVYTSKCGILYGTSIGTKNSKGEDVGLIYKISCEERMKTAFNGPIFDDESSFMYPGTGFGFNYFAKTIVDCKGDWKTEFATAAEDYIRTYIKDRYKDAFQKDVGTPITDFYDSASKKMAGIKILYENWKINYFGPSKPTGIITDEELQPKITGIINDEHKFNLVFDKVGENSCGDELPIRDLKDFQRQESYTIQMKLPMLTYNKNGDGSNKYIVGDCDVKKDNNCLGRIFPVSEIKEFVGKDYKYKVEVSGLGMGNNWTNFETCGITMRDKNVYFRSINLSDPFIEKLNSGHEIGLNWKNSRFDFKNLIKEDLWTKQPEYNQIRITIEDGKNIKNDIGKNNGYYIGICSSGSASAASTVCAKYKEMMAGKN